MPGWPDTRGKGLITGNATHITFSLTLRELCDTLAEEKRSLSKTKAYLSKQQRSLKERQVAWEHTHKQWNEGMKLHQERKVCKMGVEREGRFFSHWEGWDYNATYLKQYPSLQ